MNKLLLVTNDDALVALFSETVLDIDLNRFFQFVHIKASIPMLQRAQTQHVFDVVVLDLRSSLKTAESLAHLARFLQPDPRPFLIGVGRGAAYAGFVDTVIPDMGSIHLIDSMVRLAVAPPPFRSPWG